MKMLCLLLLGVAALGGGASERSQAVTQSQPPVAISEVTWGEHPLSISARKFGSPHRTSNTLIVSVTNTGTLPVESVRVTFLFSDPDTGEVLFHYKSRSKKRLLPGESRMIQKAVLTRPGWSPSIDDLAAKSAVVTEVKYSDGSVWRPQ